MKEILLIGMPSGYEWLLILAVIVLLFGASRLPQLAKALGQSKRAFREGQDEAEAAERESARKRAEIAAAPSQISSAKDEEIFEEAPRRASSTPKS